MGDISSYAFGLVNQKQLHEVKRYVNKRVKSQQQLFCRSQELRGGS